MATLRLYHRKHFAVVRPEDVPAGTEMLGPVLVASDDTVRQKIEVVDENGYTVIETYLDGAANTTDVSGLVAMIEAGHASPSAIHSISGTDTRLVSRLAALLDAAIIDHPKG